VGRCQEQVYVLEAELELEQVRTVGKYRKIGNVDLRIQKNKLKSKKRGEEGEEWKERKQEQMRNRYQFR
jgi:hypothetical protein